MSSVNKAVIDTHNKSDRIIDYKWYKSPDGIQFLSSLSDTVEENDKSKTKQFGIIEYPSISPSVHTVAYKIFISGKSCVGKTFFIQKLSGKVPDSKYSETNGISVTNVFWPACVNGYVVLYKLEIWDAGYNSSKCFDHVIPACIDKVDLIIFMFSHTDKKSFEDLPRNINSLVKIVPNVSSLIVGSKLDYQTQSLVSSTDIQSLEEHWKICCLNCGIPSPDQAQKDFSETAYILNKICQILWERDEKLLLKRFNKLSVDETI